MNVERGRNRIARLGVFDSVNVRYDPVDDQTRNVIYQLHEAKTLEFALLLGWGSYEMLRGGFELEERNAWGLAHDVKLKAIQSFKSTSADFRYTIPDLLVEDVDVFVNAAGLRREEISFLRQESGGGAGVHTLLRPLHTDLTVRYDYQLLNAQNAPVDPPSELGVKDTHASSFIIEVTRNRLDNPLSPRSGLKLFGTFEFASASLGGDVDYQRFVVGGHHGLGGGRYIHLGVQHGISFTEGGTSEELPFNKRFFPGGENSLRGFQEGEAAPRDAQGAIIGAETYLQGNIELEQFLTENWSVIGFADAVGFAASRRNYTFDETLYSVGGGLRWKTVVGPVRLEYGYNLNPLLHDPIGTVHFSLGFPF